MKKSPRQPLRAEHIATGEVTWFPSCMSAERAGFNRRNIWSCEAGKRKSHAGYRWLYVRKTNNVKNK